MTRGILYVYWGDKIQGELDRSVESVRRYHPDLPIEFAKLSGEGHGLLSKAQMLDLSPFDTTLFLDTDTVVLDRLDFGFEKAERFDLACCICECPWARRFGDLSGDVVEYNTGVLFFTKKAKPLFDEWKRLSPVMDSSIRFHRKNQVCVQPSNDQGPFAKAVEDLGFNPFVLPLNWNLRPQWQQRFFGPVKIWHDRSEVPMHVLGWNEHQRLNESIIRFGGIG